MCGGVRVQSGDFADKRISAIWPIFYRIHSMFLSSGYRHSDIAAHHSLLRDSPVIDRHYIAKRIVEFEMEVVQIALLGNIEREYLVDAIGRSFSSATLDCRAWLSRLGLITDVALQESGS